MAYHIKSQNVFGNDTYISGENVSEERDLRWTEDFSERKVFPTYFQVEQVMNCEESVATGVNGMKYTPARWRKATIVKES